MWADALSVQLNAADTQSIETALRCKNWEAKAISRNKDSREQKPSYVAFYRKEFAVEETPASAVIHASALGGIFKLYLNGQFVNDGPPRINYQGTPFYCSYDLTRCSKPGANAQAFASSGGAVVAQLEFRDPDGAVVQTVVTEKSWKASPSPRHATGHDFHVPGGKTEIYSARNEPTRWKLSGFDDSQWESVQANSVRKLNRSELPPYVREVCLPKKIAFQGEVTEMLGAPPWHEGVGFQMATEIPLASEKTSIENAEGLKITRKRETGI
jgi:hypothetical protein